MATRWACFFPIKWDSFDAMFIFRSHAVQCHLARADVVFRMLVVGGLGTAVAVNCAAADRTGVGFCIKSESAICRCVGYDVDEGDYR
jgi:hypothetical protein